MIARLRALTDVPIMVGGYGFTTNVAGLARFLQADYGVQGEPDEVFAHFEDVLRDKDLSRVPNLVYRDEDGYQQGPRQFFDPFPEPEYTDELYDELKQFYGTPTLQSQMVSIEIARGCPCQCYYCSEPSTKGRAFRRRSFDAVMQDVERGIQHGFTKFFFVCSEIGDPVGDVLWPRR